MKLNSLKLYLNFEIFVNESFIQNIWLIQELSTG